MPIQQTFTYDIAQGKWPRFRGSNVDVIPTTITTTAERTDKSRKKALEPLFFFKCPSYRTYYPEILDLESLRFLFCNKHDKI